jgi:hypothetical protein
MKAIIVFFSIFILTASVTRAQMVVDPKTSKTTATKTTNTKSTTKKSKFDADRSINKANAAVNKTSQTANNTTDLLSSTADKAKQFVHKVGALIPSKKHDAGAADNSTEITVKGLTFATLNKLNENIQACAGVQSTKMKFSGSKSTIEVTHSGTTANLLKQIEGKSKDVFTDENVSDFKEGKIYIKLK